MPRSCSSCSGRGYARAGPRQPDRWIEPTGMHTRRPQARPEVADPAALLRTQAEPGRLPPLSPESRGAARGAELSQDRLPSGPSAQRPGRRQRRLRGVPARAMDGWALGGGRPAQGHALSRACHHSKPWLGVGTGAAFQRRPGAGAAAGWRPWAVCGRRPARARPASECGSVVTLTAKRCDVGQDELRTVSEAISYFWQRRTCAAPAAPAAARGAAAVDRRVDTVCCAVYARDTQRRPCDVSKNLCVGVWRSDRRHTRQEDLCEIRLVLHSTNYLLTFLLVTSLGCFFWFFWRKWFIRE